MRENLRRVGRLQRLAVFEAAARLGSFTAAAADLGTTQPAVTRQIRLLEQSLGADLFTRGANTATLTDLGVRLRDHVSAGLDVLEAGLAEMAENAGTLMLAVNPGLAQQWLLPRLDSLTEAMGELELRLMLFERDEDMTQGGFDAAIRIGNGDFPGQVSHRLFSEVVVPVASPGLASEYGLDQHSSAQEVYQAPFVHMDDGDRPWMTWSQWLGRFGISLRRQPARVLFNSYPLVVQQVLAGRGVGLGWRPLIDDLVASEGLTVVGPEVTSNRSWYLVWSDSAKTGAVDALRAWFDQQLHPANPVTGANPEPEPMLTTPAAEPDRRAT